MLRVAVVSNFIDKKNGAIEVNITTGEECCFQTRMQTKNPLQSAKEVEHVIVLRHSIVKVTRGLSKLGELRFTDPVRRMSAHPRQDFFHSAGDQRDAAVGKGRRDERHDLLVISSFISLCKLNWIVPQITTVFCLGKNVVQ
jgi:hypothetical protein